MLVAGAPAMASAQQTPPPPPAPPAPQTQIIPAPPLERPISGFVVDARGAVAKFGQRLTTAQALHVETADLPGPGLGGAIGAHVYPFRLGRIAFGVGGEILFSTRSRQPLDDKEEPDGPLLHSRFTSLAPQISLNFGHRNGWSYASAGMGTARFETWADTAKMPDRKVRAINYGGGARWFMASHLAFTVDLRFYAVSPGPAAKKLIERPRQRLMVLSAGISVR